MILSHWQAALPVTEPRPCSDRSVTGLLPGAAASAANRPGLRPRAGQSHLQIEARGRLPVSVTQVSPATAAGRLQKQHAFH